MTLTVLDDLGIEGDPARAEAPIASVDPSGHGGQLRSGKTSIRSGSESEAAAAT